MIKASSLHSRCGGWAAPQCPHLTSTPGLISGFFPINNSFTSFLSNLPDQVITLLRSLKFAASILLDPSVFIVLKNLIRRERQAQDIDRVRRPGKKCDD